MRSDMFEVIIERPRRGGSFLRRRPLPRPDEASPTWQPVSRGRGSKWLNENLAPLRRWLRRQVNRPWDRVFSELCAGVSVRSAVQKHVRDHVPDLVDLHVVEVDGRLVSRRWGSLIAVDPAPREHLYVCPRTGLLRATRRLEPRRGPWKPRLALRWIDDTHAAVHVPEGWFHVAFAPIPDGLVPCFDVVLRRTLGPFTDRRSELLRTYGRPLVAVEKRQLSRRELRDAGIRQ